MLKINFCIQNYKLEQSLYVLVRQTLQIHMQLIWVKWQHTLYDQCFLTIDFVLFVFFSTILWYKMECEGKKVRDGLHSMWHQQLTTE